MQDHLMQDHTTCSRVIVLVVRPSHYTTMNAHVMHTQQCQTDKHACHMCRSTASHISSNDVHCEASLQAKRRSFEPTSKEWQWLDARAHNAHASHYCHNDHRHHDYCTSRIPSFLYTPPLAVPSKHLPGTSTRDGQFNT